MAGDWIKMRTDLYRDPKVCLIADALMTQGSQLAGYVSQNMQRDMTVTRNVMRNVTVGALVSVWGVLRHRGKRVECDLVIKGCTVSVVDDVADIQGFGEAMESVGWLKNSPDGIVLPRFFEEFNVDPSEDSKAKNAERQRRYREKQAGKSNDERNVTVTSKSNAREEKRREDSSVPIGTGGKPPIDPVKDEIWKRGLPLLRMQFPDEQSVRPFLGKICKDYGNLLVLEAVRDADHAQPMDVKSWLVARCQERRAQSGNKASALEARNREAVKEALRIAEGTNHA